MMQNVQKFRSVNITQKCTIWRGFFLCDKFNFLSLSGGDMILGVICQTDYLGRVRWEEQWNYFLLWVVHTSATYVDIKGLVISADVRKGFICAVSVICRGNHNYWIAQEQFTLWSDPVKRKYFTNLTSYLFDMTLLTEL